MTTIQKLASHGLWIARIVGTLMALFLLAFVLGEGPPPLWRMTVREQVYALGLAGLYGGLVVAWFRQELGGMVTLGGWALLAGLASKPPLDWPLLLPAVVGALHLLCWWPLRDQVEPRRPRWVLALVYGPLPMFVLLCANEMFGQPPLMTAPVRPVTELAGTWTASVATAQGRPLTHTMELTIGADGAVRGLMGEAEVTSARLLPNRSWFGRLMNWRTDYVMRGKVADQSFSILVDLEDGELKGSLVRQDEKRSVRVRLRRR